MGRTEQVKLIRAAYARQKTHGKAIEKMLEKTEKAILQAHLHGTRILRLPRAKRRRTFCARA